MCDVQSIRTPPRYIQKLKAFSRGKATLRWPSIKGVSHKAMASITGTDTRNIIDEPCRLKASLNSCGPNRFRAGNASCMRMSTAIRPSRIRSATATRM